MIRYDLGEVGANMPSKFFESIDETAKFLGMNVDVLRLLTSGEHVTDKNDKVWVLWIGMV